MYPTNNYGPSPMNMMPYYNNLPNAQMLAPYLNMPLEYPEDMERDMSMYIGEERQPQPPIVTNPTPSVFIALRKELSGYPNYGNPSRNADILYTGTQGTYTFNIPAFLLVPGNLSATLIIRGVLDDHYNVNENLYSATVNINGRQAFSGRVPFVHGRPAGQMFNNWRDLRLDIPNIRRNNTITIRNTSRAGSGDWIGLDWIELRLNPR